MKSRAYTSPPAKRLLLALAVVILPLLAVSETQAKNLRRTPGKPTIAIVSMADLSGTNIKSPAELKARLRHLMARTPKAVKILVKGSGCPAATPDVLAGSFWGCLKNCMSEVGVSVVSLIMCGGSCVAAGTGIGAIVCALCVGVSVTVVQTCALGCVMKGGKTIGIIMETNARNTKHRRASPGSLQAKLRLQTASG